MDNSTKLIVISAILSIVGAMFSGGYLFSKAGHPFGRIVSNSLWMALFSFGVIFFFIAAWLGVGLPKEVLPALFPFVVFGFFYWLSYKERKSEDSNDSVNQYNGGNETKVFQCPSCTQKLRVPTPPPKSVGKCSACDARYKLSEDANGFLYIYLVNVNAQSTNEPKLNISRCYEVLEVSVNALPCDIKAAYKRKIKDYHPDKVSTMGAELRALAERKSKEIIRAYQMLKEHGLAE